MLLWMMGHKGPGREEERLAVVTAQPADFLVWDIFSLGVGLTCSRSLCAGVALPCAGPCVAVARGDRGDSPL